MENRSTYSSKLKCRWSAWQVLDDGHLRLEMPAGSVCDMRGAIKMAEALTPLVWRIDTYSGGKPDTIYVIRGAEWAAYEPGEVLTKLLHKHATA